MTITDRDMREQVTTSLEPYEEDYDVNAIVDEIQAKYGTININKFPDDVEVYWTIVKSHLRK